MSVVTLVSGGLDSTLVACLTKESGIEQHPLFINYGQRALERELAACRRALKDIGVEGLQVAELQGYGQLIRSGLTDVEFNIVDDAFTPGRNMLFLLSGAAFAFQKNADAVAIGLLNENTSLFPDQTSAFLTDAEGLLTRMLGKKIKVLAPLAQFYKRDVVELAAQKGIKNTYSCHAGSAEPCGKCIACREFIY